MSKNVGELRQRLKLYSKAKAEKRELEIRLKELNHIDISAIDYSKDNVSSGEINSSTENQAIKLTETQEKLNKLITEKWFEIERVENALSILNESEKEIIELKHIKSHSWETVCYKCNRSLITVKRIEKDSLHKMLAILNIKV